VSVVAGIAGWLLSGALVVVVLRMSRRLELTARACHELRGPAAALSLAVASLAREPQGRRLALAFETQLERLRVGLDDLEAARRGCRASSASADIPLDRYLRSAADGWRPAAQAVGRGIELRSELGPTVVCAPRGRLSQALGNLVANAVEHGSGTVELLGRRSGDRVLVEVRDEGPSAAGEGSRCGRGRGLRIASTAAADAGGQLSLATDKRGTVAALELPAKEL
jgi:signal transduction histidine kinase